MSITISEAWRNALGLKIFGFIMLRFIKITLIHLC